jgi:cytochrome c biogenesis protein CcmG/thiol:disulfide interchange protein DsbE
MTTHPDTEPSTPTSLPSGGSRWRIVRWIALAVAVVVIAVGALLGTRIGKDPKLVDSPLLGHAAPTERVPYLEHSGTLSLADLRGGIVVVNFWASWCVPCREEQATLVAAAEAYHPSGVTFVGVDYQDQHATAVAFLNELGRGDAAAYLYVTDHDSKLALDFGVFGVPETFFLDRHGTIVAKITGATDPPLLGTTLNDILTGRKPTSHTGGTVQSTPGAG